MRHYAIIACAAAGLAAADRPNVICLVSEDSVRYLGCYGDTVARTPVLDALAREGVLFNHCYTAAVCAPSRFGLITGLYPTACGPADQMRASGNIPSWVRGIPAYLRDAGYYTTNNAKTDYNAPIDVRDAWDDCSGKAHWQNRPAGKPFFAVFNMENTHESCLHGRGKDRAGRFAGTTDPAKVVLPPYLPDVPEMRQDQAHVYDCVARMDERVGEFLKEIADAGLAEDTIVLYYGDNGGVMPRSKRFMYDSGTRVPFIMRIPAKWRAVAPGDPGTRSDRLVHFIDIGPTVLSMTGTPIPRQLHGQPFAGPQQAPPRRYAFVYRDRMDGTQDMVRGVKDGRFSYLRNYMPQVAYGVHQAYQFKAKGYQAWKALHDAGKLTGIQEAFWNAKPFEELYDTQADPHEVRNLAADPAFAADLARLRAALREHLVAVNDNGFLPECSPLQGYTQSRDPVAYPLARIIEVADLAIQRDVQHLPVFIAALADPAEGMRWWGAIGCTLLEARAAPAREALTARLDEAMPGVRLAAAEALCHQGQAAQGLPVLEKGLTHTAMEVRLQAANILARLGPAARPALAAMKAATAHKEDRGKGKATRHDEYPIEVLRHAVEVLERAP